jgi:RNA polymerase sigma-70 factor (ECF subfamily)
MPDEASVKLFVDAFFREKWRDIIVVLTRRFGPQHLDDIENAVQTAMVRALDTWPLAGIPDNPGGWIFTVAKNHMLDRLRKLKRAADRAGPLEDDTLRMILVCCHPRLTARESIAITLRLICGLGTQDIAGALLIGDDAARKLLYRTKDKIRRRRFPFELPEPDEQAARLNRVLQIIYLQFNEGYAARTGDDLTRNDLCAEAQRLADLLLRSQMAEKGSVWALAALMAFQASRLPARVDGEGRLLRLQEQDRPRWDRRQIALGFDLLDQSMSSSERSRYHLEAAIAACHAAAETYDDTDWPRIRGFYDDLMALVPSPVVELNRSVAVMMTDGPAAGLTVLQTLEDAPALKDSYLLPALQGDFEARAGRPDLAERHYRDALDKSENSPVRAFLADQISACSIG